METFPWKRSHRPEESLIAASGVTIRDVAARAGVSLGTASRVLSGHPATSPGARARVSEAATALGRRMEQAIRQPLAVDGAEHRLTASFGIALGDADAVALPARADAAVYRAKAAWRGRVEVWCA